MGRTFRRNDRFKKDRRDRNFKKSKKFKEFKQGGYVPPPKSADISIEDASVPLEEEDIV